MSKHGPLNGDLEYLLTKLKPCFLLEGAFHEFEAEVSRH